MVLKLIEQSAKRLYVDLQLLRKFKTRYPKMISLPGSAHVLAVNPHDRRVRKKILGDWLVRGRIPRNQWLWNLLVRQFAPTVALDIGLNYGECLFSADYLPETRVFGIEGNELIRPCIEESRAKHPHCDLIEPIFQLASDHIKDQVDFYVHRNWSGGSTAGEVSRRDQNFAHVVTQSTTIDEVMRLYQADTSRAVFKIDVEGFEARVLRGMHGLLESAETAIGFIEFSPALLQRSGENVEAFWNSLRQQFAVAAFNRADHLTDCSDLSLSDLEDYCGKSFHTDLLLATPASNIDIAQILPARTRQRRRAA